MPPGRPEAPDLSPSSAAPQTALSVTWNAPADNGSAITGYRLRYRVKGAQSWSSVNTTSTSTVLSGLTAATTYEAQVLANNSVGSGVWSPTGTGATLAYPTPTPTPTNGKPKLGSGTTFDVAENSPAETTVGTPVAASDPDGDTLAYAVSGADEFAIDASTGQISVAQGANLDYESVTSYTVAVSVTDGVDANWQRRPVSGRLHEGDHQRDGRGRAAGQARRAFGDPRPQLASQQAHRRLGGPCQHRSCHNRLRPSLPRRGRVRLDRPRRGYSHHHPDRRPQERHDLRGPGARRQRRGRRPLVRLRLRRDGEARPGAHGHPDACADGSAGGHHCVCPADGNSDTRAAHGHSDVCAANGNTDIRAADGNPDACPAHGNSDACAANGNPDACAANGNPDTCATDGNSDVRAAHGDPDDGPVSIVRSGLAR